MLSKSKLNIHENVEVCILVVPCPKILGEKSKILMELLRTSIFPLTKNIKTKQNKTKQNNWNECSYKIQLVYSDLLCLVSRNADQIRKQKALLNDLKMTLYGHFGNNGDNSSLIPAGFFEFSDHSIRAGNSKRSVSRRRDNFSLGE